MDGRIENGLMLMVGGQASQKPNFLKGFESHPLYQRGIAIANDLGIGEAAMRRHNYATLNDLATNNAEAGHLNDPDINSFLNSLYNLILIWEFREKLKAAGIVDECEPLGTWNFIRQDAGHEEKPFFQVSSGISVGEAVAMTAAGMLSADDAMQTIAIRGKGLQDASMRNRNSGEQGAMLPLLGKPVAEVQEILTPYEGRVRIRNSNIVMETDPKKNQLIIGGLMADIVAIRDALIELNPRMAKIIKLLPAGDAYHGPNMAPADKALEAALAAKNLSGAIHTPNVIVLDHEGRPQQVTASNDPNGVVQRFSRQAVSPIAPYMIAQAAMHGGVTQAIAFDANKKSTGAILTGNGMPKVHAIADTIDISQLDLEKLDHPSQFSLKAMTATVRQAFGRIAHGE